MIGRTRPAQALAWLALTVVLIGCGAPASSVRSAAPTPGDSGVPPSPVAPPSGAPTASDTPTVEHSAWQQEQANVTPGEPRSLESALRLVAMAFGPVPGVDVPTDPGQIFSADAAIRAIEGRLDELTPEQRTVVAGFLALPSDGPRYEVPPAGDDQTGLRSAPFAPAMVDLGAGAAGLVRQVAPGIIVGGPFEVVVADMVTELRAELARRWHDFPGSMAVLFTDEPYPALSYSLPAYADEGAGSFSSCTLIVTPAGLAASSGQLQYSIAHDLFHCAQAYDGASPRTRVAAPLWVWNGQAEYFAQETAALADAATLSGPWSAYMLDPETPLTERSEDAVGFWAHLGYVFGSAYSTMSAALVEGSDAERFVRAGANAPAFLDTWASGLFRNPLAWSGASGRAWDTDGPNLSSVLDGPRTVVTIADNDARRFEQAAYSNRLYAISVTADTARVQFDGHARLADGGGGNATFDSTELASVTFCFTDAGCQPCPDDPPGEAPIRLETGIPILAVSGGLDGTSGSIRGANRVCPTPTPPPTPAPTINREFCDRYRALLTWWQNPTSEELSKPWALYIVNASVDMRPYAPPEIQSWVDVVIDAYGTYGLAPSPFDVPMAGPAAARLVDAALAMDAYCGVRRPEEFP